MKVPYEISVPELLFDALRLRMATRITPMRTQIIQRGQPWSPPKRPVGRRSGPGGGGGISELMAHSVERFAENTRQDARVQRVPGGPQEARSAA